MTPGTKLGGLPAWAWGLVVLGGLGVGLWLRHRSGSPTAVGVPVSTGSLLGATGGGASDGTPAGSITGGIDPVFAQLISDSNSALVNESGILAGLTAQSVDGALGAATTTLGQATSLFTTFSTLVAPIFTAAASPAGGSPSGTTPPQVPPTTLVNPEPPPALTVPDTPPPAILPPDPPAPPPALVTQTTAPAVTPPVVFVAPHVGTGGVIVSNPAAPGVPALVDVSGHVVNAKGFRVGGATMDT